MGGGGGECNPQCHALSTLSGWGRGEGGGGGGGRGEIKKLQAMPETERQTGGGSEDETFTRAEGTILFERVAYRHSCVGQWVLLVPQG